MSRLDYVTIAIVAVCVAALVYLIYMTTNLLGGDDNEPESATATTDPYEEGYEDDQTATFNGDSAALADENGYDGASYDDEDDYQDDYDTGANDDTYRDKGGYEDSGYDDSSADEPEDAYEDTRTPASSASEDYASVSAGDYMVLAGTFQYKSNAENMVRKLRNMGYDDARTELFDRGAYAVALVDHYPDYDEAKRIANELTNSGVSAYVKKK
ncbi:MAG: hypothetical protein GVY26_10590 [Bacteroidetes bacterium]|jgi:hypothetical protein|nr:hypothetical protein [Bacteroidota bacterium]